MVEKAGYKISDIYQGGYSGLTPPSNTYLAAGSLGMTTDPRSANLLQEVSSKLSSGAKQIEIEGVSDKIFDSIPKQHLKEVHRLSKLTGIDVSLHGPVIDVAGFTQSGFSENDRELAEEKVTQVLLRSHELNPSGNIPVNFHSAEGIPGSQFLPPRKRTEETGDYRKMIAVNRETGRMAPLEPDLEYHPGGNVKGEIKTPERRLDNLNSTEWRNSLFQIEVNRENAERIMKDVHPIVIARAAALRSGKLNPAEISGDEKEQIHKIFSAYEFVEQAKMSADSLFSKAYEFAKADGDVKRMSDLKNFSEKYGELIGVEDGKIKSPEKYLNPKIHSEALRELIGTLEENSPKMWVPIEDFAIKKSSQTYGNAAFEAYKKFKDKSPILVIENPPAGFALSTGKDIKNIVVASRKQFVDNAVKEGMSESEAKRQAEKFIGATWDVGHINMLRKFGYDEKEIIKEAEQVAPYVKHVHLSDNFGLEHTELPMGMGNVPLKEIMEKLGEKGFNARKIIEAADWWQHIKTSPFQETLEAAGSPLYSMYMAPYWSQAPGLYQGYHGGLDGQWLPQINYETFGTSFARLPKELGGTPQGAQGSRMSGRPME
ncbi:sugar phosphate isomerase/epimerase [Candidatus Pacearchaeota archaeon]|nr:sugar phosphate isomerase/epimerase [Candidatus Pacearchaeota archaeon]